MSPVVLTFSNTLPPSPVAQDSAASQHDATPAASEQGNEKKIEEYAAEPLEKDLSRIDTADYPNAFSLTMITIALMLAVFLGALGSSNKHLPSRTDNLTDTQI